MDAREALLPVWLCGGADHGGNGNGNTPGVSVGDPDVGAERWTP